MRTVDLTPLYRSAIGFDRLANLFDSAVSNSAPNFPPYNIERVEDDQYRITMAVAGFSESDIDITVERNALIISGNQNKDDAQSREFLYQGIAERNFERRFQLADHVKVTGANIQDGLLNIDLQREIPEEMKPRKIEISKSNAKLVKAK